MATQIWGDGIHLPELRAQREDFTQKIVEIKRNQKTCIHIIISVITCGIFAIIKVVHLWILEMAVKNLDQRIHKYEPFELDNASLGDAVIDISPGSVEIRVKDPLDKMREMNKSLIQAMNDIAEKSPKKDDILICFDQITEIFCEVKRELGTEKAVSKVDVVDKLQNALKNLDKALAKAKEHFAVHEKFKAFEERCCELRENLSSEIEKLCKTHEPFVNPQKSVKINTSKIVVSDFLKGILPKGQLEVFINDLEEIVHFERLIADSIKSLPKANQSIQNSINELSKIVKTVEKSYFMITDILKSPTLEEVFALLKSLTTELRSFVNLDIDIMDLNFGSFSLTSNDKENIHALNRHFGKFNECLKKLSLSYDELLENITDKSFKASLAKEFAHMVGDSSEMISVSKDHSVKIEVPRIVVSEFLKGILPQDKLAPVINLIEEFMEVIRKTAISVETVKSTDERVLESVNFIKRIFQTVEDGYSQIRQLFQSSTAEESATIFMSLVNKAKIFEDLNFEKFDPKIDPTAAMDESLTAIMIIIFNFFQSMKKFEVLQNHVGDLMEGITDESFKAAVDKEFAKVDTESLNVIKISEEKLNAIAVLLGVLKEIPRDFPTIISTCGMIFDQAIELQSHLKPEMNKDLLIALLKNLNVMMELAKKMKTMVVEKGDLDPSAPVDPVIYQNIEDGVTKLCDLLQGLLNEEAKTS